MSKILVIPDVHGTSCWKQAKQIVKDQHVDYIVGLGDWVDSWENEWPEQGENLKEGLDWFREDPEHRFFCIGNHDFSYITNTWQGHKVSGHQYVHADEIKAILEDNKDIIHYCIELDGWVFSHAGISRIWVDNYLKPILHFIYDTDKKAWDEKDFDVKLVDKTLIENATSFERLNELIDWHGVWSGTGDEVEQGLLWIRPRALISNMKYSKQVVGHTEWAMGEPVRLKKRTDKLLVVDSKKHDNLYILDTETEENNKFITFLDFEKKLKKIDYTIDVLRSKKITDEKTIKRELSKIKLSEKEIEAHYKKLNKEFNKVCETE